jgi:predicted O-methyltransferase YrrM
LPDADKRSNDVYFEHAIALSRPGSVIIVDNVIRKGAIVDDSTDDPDVRGTRRLLMGLRGDRRVTTTVLQTVGSKGHDGFLFAIVN